MAMATGQFQTQHWPRFLEEYINGCNSTSTDERSSAADVVLTPSAAAVCPVPGLRQRLGRRTVDAVAGDVIWPDQPQLRNRDCCFRVCASSLKSDCVGEGEDLGVPISPVYPYGRTYEYLI
jgi:hypothetical protein